MKLELHSGAKRDLDRAVGYYASEASAAVVARFLAEYERVVGLVLAFPGSGSPRSKGRRSFSLSGFPYSVVYRELPGNIRILMVKHDRLHPDYGSRRA